MNYHPCNKKCMGSLCSVAGRGTKQVQAEAEKVGKGQSTLRFVLYPEHNGKILNSFKNMGKLIRFVNQNCLYRGDLDR